MDDRCCLCRQIHAELNFRLAHPRSERNPPQAERSVTEQFEKVFGTSRSGCIGRQLALLIHTPAARCGKADAESVPTIGHQTFRARAKSCWVSGLLRFCIFTCSFRHDPAFRKNTLAAECRDGCPCSHFSCQLRLARRMGEPGMTIALILVVALAVIVLYGFWLAGKFGIGPFQPQSRLGRTNRLDTERTDSRARSRQAG